MSLFSFMQFKPIRSFNCHLVEPIHVQVFSIFNFRKHLISLKLLTDYLDTIFDFRQNLLLL